MPHKGEQSARQGQGSQPLAENSQDTELLQSSKVILVDPCDVVAIEFPAEKRGRDQQGSTQRVARIWGSSITPQRSETVAAFVCHLPRM